MNYLLFQDEAVAVPVKTTPKGKKKGKAVPTNGVKAQGSDDGSFG